MHTETPTYPKLSDTQAVIDACAARPDVAPFARIVGRWVWVEFPTRPAPDTLAFLKATGFRWNRERLAWQHACGVFTRRNRRIDPRQVYGERGIEESPNPELVPQPTAQRSAIHDTMQTFIAA